MPLLMDSRSDPARLGLLEALHAHGSGASRHAELFHALVRIACRQWQCPMAGVSFIAADHERFLASAGFASASAHAAPSFAMNLLNTGMPDALIVPDTQLEAQFSDHPLVVGGLRIRTYAAAPVLVEGYCVACVSVMGCEPRFPSPGDVQTLRDLATIVADVLTDDLRRLGFNCGAAAASLLPAQAPTAAVVQPLRLMYVEDNRINAILFEEALRLREDIELRLAEDGEDALQQVSQWRPDVLVLDSHLPGMNGFELLQALRRVPGLATAPAFMCSADASPDDIDHAATAGFIGYWLKPMDMAQMFADLDRACAGIRSERAQRLG